MFVAHWPDKQTGNDDALAPKQRLFSLPKHILTRKCKIFVAHWPDKQTGNDDALAPKQRLFSLPDTFCPENTKYLWRIGRINKQETMTHWPQNKDCFRSPTHSAPKIQNICGALAG